MTSASPGPAIAAKLFSVCMSSDSTPQRDLSLLCTEFQGLVKDLDSFELHGETGAGSLAHLLKDCKLKPDELKLRVHKFNIVMKNSKQFLDSCDSFLQSLANMNTVAGPVYGAVKFIVTVRHFFRWQDWIENAPIQIAAAKSDILDGMIPLQLECLFIDAYVRGSRRSQRRIRWASPNHPFGEGVKALQPRTSGDYFGFDSFCDFRQ
jgi:hypothetical protein